MVWTGLHLDSALLDAASGVYSRLRMPSRSSVVQLAVLQTGEERNLLRGRGLCGHPVGNEFLKRRLLAQKGELRVNSEIRQPAIPFFIRFLQPHQRLLPISQ